MAKFNLFNGALGINNAVDPKLLKYNEAGQCELAKAVNVIIDENLGVSSRFGRDLLRAGGAHSLWSFGEYCFFVSSGILYRYMLNGSILQVATCGDAPMYFMELGGKILASNGSFRAVLYDTTVEDYVAKVPLQYAGDTRVLGIPDSFTKVVRFNSRAYAVAGNILWESEPYNFQCFNLATGYIPFSSEIFDLTTIGAGIYVSTKYGMSYLQGQSSENFERKIVSSYPAIAGTLKRIDGHLVGAGDIIRGEGAIWVSQLGVCVGSEFGVMTNLTNRRLVLDTIANFSSGSSVLFGNHYIFSLEV